jgi:hypothetical protein
MIINDLNLSIFFIEIFLSIYLNFYNDNLPLNIKMGKRKYH